MNGLLDAPAAVGERVEYELLDPVDEALICFWLLDLGINPHHTPTHGLIEYDPVHDEWRIEQWKLDLERGDNCPLIVDGEAVTYIRRVRRRGTALPWPTWAQKIDELWERVTDPDP